MFFLLFKNETLKTIFHASLEIHCVDADLPIKSLQNFLNHPMGSFNNYGDKKRVGGWSVERPQGVTLQRVDTGSPRLVQFHLKVS